MALYCGLTVLVAASVLRTASAQRFLSVSGGQLRLNNEKVFLSGVNLAWHQYGNDFGNGVYDCCTGAVLEDYLQRVANAGGNSIRIWIHCDSWATPEYDSNGFVTGTDGSNTMTADLGKFLDRAYELNILVVPVLWNGATALHPMYRDLIWDETKLQSYIDNALTPLVIGLRDKVALGSWEIMNEPEAILAVSDSNSNPCFDTTNLAGSGAGWANEYIPMELLLRFINRQIAAIRNLDPNHSHTLGSWNERAQTDSFSGYRNYYKDECLIAAGGETTGTIDYQQMHTYAWQGFYSTTSPIVINNADFGLSKPNVIGEFSQSGGDGRDITEQFEHLYTEGYSGAWSWQANGGGTNADDFATQARGMGHLRGRNDQNTGGRVNFVFQ